MAKRRATDQITKDGAFARDDSASSDDDSSVGGVQKAGADVMARRKIAVPRSRLSKAADVPAARPASSSSPFAALSQPAAAAAPAAKPSAPSESSPAAANAANPFSFLSSSSARPNSSSSSVFAASSGSASANANANTSAAGTHSSQELKLRSLNSSFAAKIAKADANSPFADWSHMCEKYLEYAKTIAAGTATSRAPTPAAAADKAETKAEARSEPATTPRSGLTSTGFKFSAGPTSASFQFGDKKIDIKAAAQPSKSTGGFVFNAGGKGEIRTGAPADAPTAAPKSEKPQFTFGQASSAPEKSESTSEKPHFTFGKSSTDEASKPAFSFGASKDAESTKPAFSFGAPKEKEAESPKPAFAFGAPKESKGDAPKPAFSFGAAKDSDASIPKPAFTFGAAKADSAKPAFAFGKAATDDAAKDDAKPVFSFGGAKEGSNNAQPAFSFGGAKEGNNAQPAFSFGGGSKEGDAKPVFSFGSGASSSPPAADAKPVFSFGEKSESKPSFSFGTAKPDAVKPDAAKPAFSFGSSNGSSAGSSASSAHKSSLSFGTGVNPFGATQNEATWKPGNAVSIVSTESASATPGAGEQPAEGGAPSDEQTDEQTDLGGPGPGEENEEAVFEKKAKLFELVDGEYKTQGLGMLRVLVHKETKKARALLRAEGSGRVLLNVALRKEFNYSVVGKGQVKLVDVKSGTDAPTVYVLRVKTEDDGNALKDKLEEVKN